MNYIKLLNKFKNLEYYYKEDNNNNSYKVEISLEEDIIEIFIYKNNIELDYLVLYIEEYSIKELNNMIKSYIKEFI